MFPAQRKEVGPSHPNASPSALPPSSLHSLFPSIVCLVQLLSDLLLDLLDGLAGVEMLRASVGAVLTAQQQHTTEGECTVSHDSTDSRLRNLSSAAVVV